MPEHDVIAEELQVYIDAMEAQADPDDNEIQAYARMKNRVQGDRNAVIARRASEIAKIDDNADRMIREIDRHDDAIEWKYGTMIAQLVAAKIKGMKQRSLKTLFGTVGYRKSPAKTTRNIRCDNATLLAWAEAYAPEAVETREIGRVQRDLLPETCEHMWIETVAAKDTFYYKPAKVQEKKDGE